MRKRTVFISFFTSCTQPCPSDLSAHTHPVCDVCVRALWLTLDGGHVWSVVLTQLRGIFLLEDAHCHRSCRFWTVYSRIMMTSLKQTRLLSCIVFLYERSMYPFHSSVTSQTHMPQLHPPHPASLPPNHVKNNRSRNSLLRHDTGEGKKKESYYDEALHVSVSFICSSPSTLDGGRVWSVVL